MNMRIESLDNAGNIYQINEIDQQQLKKQSDQAKRFINSSIKDHPQLESIKGALQVLPHHKLISVLENTQNAINGMGAKVDLVHQDMPELAKPDNDTSNSNMYAKATELLGIVSNLTTNSSLQNQLAQLQSFNATMLGAGAAYSELAELLESQGIQYQTDLDTLNSAQAESIRLGQEAKSAEAGLHNAKQTLAKLEAEAQEQDPVSTELSQQISEAKKSVLTCQAAVDETALALQQHKMNILNPAITAANNSKLALEKTLEHSRVITSSMSPQQNVLIDNQRKQINDQSKCLVFLIALMSKLIEQRASNDLTAAAELKNKLSEAAAKDAEKKAKEYEDNLRKSEEMQKVMGCIGKVLGWVITAVSFAAAAFTGGASLAFASIGLALTVGDEINQAVNGVSFMSEALKPLMEAIIQPMMELLSKAFSQILESLGVDKSIAGMVGQIIGAIATAIIMVAAVVVAGNVASKLASTAMQSFGNKAIDKVMNNVVGDMMKRIGQGLGRSFGMQETKMAKISTYTNMGLTGASMANTVVQTTGNIITGEMKVNAAKAKADLLNSTALQHLLSEMLNHAVDAFKSRIDSTNVIVKNMASIADSKMQAGKFITRKISVIAG